MTSHRLLVLSSVPVVLGAALSVVACSTSSSNSNGDTNLPAGCPADPFSVDAGTFDQTKLSREEACARFVKAVVDRANTLGCSLDPTPTCPQAIDDFEHTRYPGQCIGGYTAGGVANCECRTASYGACGDFNAKPCVLQVIVDTTGASCGGDGGADGTSDVVPDTSAFDDADAGGGG